MLKFNLIQIFSKFTFEKKGTYKVTQTSYQNIALCMSCEKVQTIRMFIKTKLIRYEMHTQQLSFLLSPDAVSDVQRDVDNKFAHGYTRLSIFYLILHVN